MYNIKQRRVRVTIIAMQKEYYMYILNVSVAFIINHAKSMHRIILSPVASLAPPNFYTLSYDTIFGKKKIIECKMCVLVFSGTFV
jgi:hypothetical protein